MSLICNSQGGRLVNFLKVHASGNDFIFVEKQDVAFVTNLTEVIVKMSHRRFGVGCDQFIVLDLPQGDGVITVEIYNQDGTACGMCGNAMRALAGWWNSRRCTEKVRAEIVYGSSRRSVALRFVDGLAGVDLGRFKIVELDGVGKIVDIGNLHNVKMNTEDVFLVPCDDFNVSYVSVRGENELFVTTIERGVGKTLCCGSGVCASAIMSLMNGVIVPNEVGLVSVKTEGTGNDSLLVDVRFDTDLCGGNVELIGGWEEVFGGVYCLK